VPADPFAIARASPTALFNEHIETTKPENNTSKLA
jgi:hypothetical protein